mmetsp:Transcript_37834/g.92980  ORF Transcript_37834/g.92980 Transcript_37834/m.92980 type:complete len:236 (-) Transcript_37834:584-1291(-)
MTSNLKRLAAGWQSRSAGRLSRPRICWCMLWACCMAASLCIASGSSCCGGGNAHAWSWNKGAQPCHPASSVCGPPGGTETTRGALVPSASGERFLGPEERDGGGEAFLTTSDFLRLFTPALAASMGCLRGVGGAEPIDGEETEEPVGESECSERGDVALDVGGVAMEMAGMTPLEGGVGMPACFSFRACSRFMAACLARIDFLAFLKGSVTAGLTFMKSGPRILARIFLPAELFQ